MEGTGIFIPPRIVECYCKFVARDASTRRESDSHVNRECGSDRYIEVYHVLRSCAGDFAEYSACSDTESFGII